MALTIRELDALSEDEAAELFRACCGSSRWVEGMVTQRPFRSEQALFEAAETIWNDCTASDWLEAFSHHPRIGAKGGVDIQSEKAKDWSHGEQESVERASTAVRDELDDVNREYEDRFGHIYIVCATDKSPDDLLAMAKSRLNNAPDTELRIAAEEQRKITRLRLGKLLGAEP